MVSQENEYKSAEAFLAALVDKSRKIAKDLGRPVDIVRRQIAFEAFLLRLPKSNTNLVLKGGFALYLRHELITRPTRDLDMAIDIKDVRSIPKNTLQKQLQKTLENIAAIQLGDFFTFEIGKVTADLGRDREFIGFRFHLLARVGSKRFDEFSVDITAGDALLLPFDKVLVGKSLEFSGVMPVFIPAVSSAQHFAEKLHAYCRDRGNKQNSRVKDLFDMIFFIRQNLDSESVARAVLDVFKNCNDTPIPVSLELPPENWRLPFQEMAASNGLGAVTLEEAYKTLSDYYSKIISKKLKFLSSES
ncbi:MAG: nucleotidyl transferase AbiEii/AbiGii toxin family protein [Oligoflexales bacterium]|nr:nucleotidyl transferase AbiEii/AbiGii toxin family protein [Oligoflexales bacterium]